MANQTIPNLATLQDTTETLIARYFLETTKATTTLYRENLCGHLLIIIYSTIDTLGLLDAPPKQTEATGDSFKDWTKNYLLSWPGIEFNETDLWSARCAVLHTFTTESRLSRDGRAKELQYYRDNKDTNEVKQAMALTIAIQGSKHLPVDIEELYLALLEGMMCFANVLLTKCDADQAYEHRLRKIIQSHPMPKAL